MFPHALSYVGNFGVSLPYSLLCKKVTAQIILMPHNSRWSCLTFYALTINYKIFPLLLSDNRTTLPPAAPSVPCPLNLTVEFIDKVYIYQYTFEPPEEAEHQIVCERLHINGVVQTTSEKFVEKS